MARHGTHAALLVNGHLINGHTWEEKRKHQLREFRVLVVDEVSVLQAKFLDYLDATARAVRDEPHAPFGGLQLIFSGDLLQYPPPGIRGAFQSACWREARFAPIEFITVQAFLRS